MQAKLDDRVIAQSDDILEVGGYAYFPPAATHLEWLEKAPKTASDLECPHGVQFYDVVLDERPQPKMQAVGGRFGFWKDVKVA
jgi:uncharacterized protein (DUF427 family)